MRTSSARMVMMAALLGLCFACSKNLEGPSNPALSISPGILDFGAALDTIVLSIKNTGAGELRWRIFPDQPWIHCDPDSGINDRQVQVTISRTQLAPGDTTASLYITSNAGSAWIRVLVTENDPPPPSCLTVSRTHDGYITVTWCAVPGAQKYGLERSMRLDDGTYTDYYYVGTLTDTSYTDFSVEQARWYRYRVAASKFDVWGAWCPPQSGFVKGCRFENVYKVQGQVSFGLGYELYAYGLMNQTRALAIYAVYYDAGIYYYVPGSGFDNKAASVTTITPPGIAVRYENQLTHIPFSYWDPSYRNNNYPQYIKMRVYESGTISSLSSSYYDQTNYFEIFWLISSTGERVAVIGHPVPSERARQIDESLGREEAGEEHR